MIYWQSSYFRSVATACCGCCCCQTYINDSSTAVERCYVVVGLRWLIGNGRANADEVWLMYNNRLQHDLWLDLAARCRHGLLVNTSVHVVCTACIIYTYIQMLCKAVHGCHLHYAKVVGTLQFESSAYMHAIRCLVVVHHFRYLITILYRWCIFLQTMLLLIWELSIALICVNLICFRKDISHTFSRLWL